MKSKTKTGAKKAKVEKKQRYFGVTKVKTGGKVAFVSKQDKNGWSLGLMLNGRNIYFTHVRFASQEEVKRALGSSVLFVEAANAKK